MGESGEPPALEPVRELRTLYDRWMNEKSSAARTGIWHRILEIHADEVFTIGIVNGARQPVVVRDRLRNVPRDGLWSYAPSSYFGIYELDAFWLDDETNRTDPS